MRIFSTFSGIGGFEIGIHNAWLRSQDAGQTVQGTQARDSQGRSEQLHQHGAEGLSFVGYSEIDKYAISVYEKHFPGVKNYGDITKINEKELPDFDCLVGGFPCQAFSIAGRRGGFDDTRGTLFFDLARILREKQPRYFVFENVKGLLSHDKGNTFRTIIATIDELGYDCQWSVLNSKDFGVPQNRERIIIVGHLRATPRPEVFPLERSARAYSKELASITVDANYFKGIDNHGQRTAVAVGTLRTHKDGNGFRDVKSGVAPTIPARAREDGSGQPVILTGQPRIDDSGRSVEYKASSDSPTIRATHYKSGDNQPVVSDGIKIRRLTPLECERLQAFPDNWTAEGVNGPISDTQRYKMCGNAVTTNVVQAVFERILR